MNATPETAHIEIAEAIDGGRWSLFQRLVVGLAALCFAVDGLANMVLGLSIPDLIRKWHATREDFAPVAAAGLIGVTIGTALGGLLGDRFGRRIGLIGSVLLFGIATALTVTSGDIGSITLLRFIAGLGIGGALPNGAALISEYTPKRQRSLAIGFGMVFIAVGGLLASILGTYILPSFGWQGLFFVSGVLPIALGVALIACLPESPRFLLRHPANRARTIALLRRFGLDIREDAVLVESEEEKGEARTRLSALLGSGMLRDTLALWCAFFFCFLASYSMFSWVPTMLAGQGFSLSTTSAGMTAFNLGGVFGGVAGGWLIGQLGSRIAVLGTAAGGVIGALLLGLVPFSPHNGLLLPILALIFEGFFIAGLSNGVYTLAAFVYPTFARATGVGAAAAVGRLGAVLSSFTGVLALTLGGASSYFVVIAAAMVLAFASIALIRQQIARVSEPRAAIPPVVAEAPAQGSLSPRQ